METRYSLDAFAHIQSVRDAIAESITLGNLPPIDEVRTLAMWTPTLKDRFEKTSLWFEGKEDGEKHDRSAAMTELAYMAAELNWTDQHIAALLFDADDRWGKYKKRHNRERLIEDLVNRARQKYGYNAPSVDLTKLIASANTSAPTVGEDRLVFGFQDFVDAEFKIDWMLKGLLAREGLGLLTGYAGVGKTQLALMLGAQLAIGEDEFLKWQNVGGKKKVMFLSLEMSKAPLNHFMQSVAKGYAPGERNTLNRNFLVAPFGIPVPLDTQEGQNLLDTVMNDHMPDLLIIDSLQKVVSKELTDEQAVKSLVHYLSGVRKRFSCAMLIIHHNRKRPNDAQKKQPTELSDVYGSTYITTDVDFVLSMKAQNEDGLLQLDTLKSRLGPQLDSFDLVRNSETLSFTTDLSDLASNFKKESGNAPEF